MGFRAFEPTRDGVNLIGSCLGRGCSLWPGMARSDWSRLGPDHAHTMLGRAAHLSIYIFDPIEKIDFFLKKDENAPQDTNI